MEFKFLNATLKGIKVVINFYNLKHSIVYQVKNRIISKL